jgi:hypothetical protein
MVERPQTLSVSLVLTPNLALFFVCCCCRFKGVDDKRDMFICRPVIGHSRGAYPRFNKAAVYKVKVFGVGVLEDETRRTRWERLPPQIKDRFLLFRPLAF